MVATNKQNVATSHGPSKTALLLLDYHNCLINMIEPTEKRNKVIASVSALLDAARQQSMVIVRSLIDFDKQPFPKSKMKEFWETNLNPMLQNTPEAADEWVDFRPKGDDSSKEILLYKDPGCISNIKSEVLLRQLREDFGIESLIMCGLSTSGAVLSTARDAADMEFVTTVVEDGCWDQNGEVHRIILDHILPMTVTVVGLSEALDIIQGA